MVVTNFYEMLHLQKTRGHGCYVNRPKNHRSTPIVGVSSTIFWILRVLALIWYMIHAVHFPCSVTLKTKPFGRDVACTTSIFVQLCDVHTRRIKDRIPSFYFFFDGKSLILKQLDSKVVLHPLINLWLFFVFFSKNSHALVTKIMLVPYNKSKGSNYYIKISVTHFM